MEIETFQYRQESGWSVKEFPSLDSDNTLVLVFSAPELIGHTEPISDLRSKYPKAKMIGCSTSGEICGSTIYDKSIVVTVVRFSHTSIFVTLEKIPDLGSSFSAGAQIVKNLAKDKLRAILVLSEGVNVNGSKLVEGINSESKKNVVVTGGLAGDGDRFKKTWVIFEGEIYTNAIAAVGFYGDKINVGHGSRGGWDIFGMERVITRSKDNVLYELDNQPALALYKKYLGERASGLPAAGLLFPMSIRKDKNAVKRLVRTFSAIDEQSQSLTFAGDMPVGYLAQLMNSNSERLIAGANEAAQSSAITLTLDKNNEKVSPPVLAIAISCVGRRLLMGERTEEEIESTLDSLPSDTKQVGFYSYGEISPFTKGDCDFHNQTMTLTIITED